MWSEWLDIVAGGSPEELERSMEQEVEGLLEIDEQDLPAAVGEAELTIELARAEESLPRAADHRELRQRPQPR